MTGKWKILFSIVMILAAMLSLRATPASAQTKYVTYIVQKGDILGAIAAKYCTTWRAIYDINQDAIGKNPNVIEPGMVLTIPANCVPAPSTPPSNNAVPDKGPMNHATGAYDPPYYTVAWGDNLSSIGARFGIPWRNIALANGIEGTTIYPGKALFISSGPIAAPPSQQGPAERVYFQTGATSATRTGLISQGIAKSYILWGRAGQTISISTSSSGEPLGVSVGNTSGDLLPLTGVNSQINNSVSTVLPASGDFIVIVRAITPPENPQLSFTVSFVIQQE